ncbi:cell wall-binding repeat-containing protein [Mobiluncus curtisii]|uniref:Cell wall binding repeat 2 n=2 Tax=Mobiluncus curtisii TaxID=2051 RepID=A0A2X2YMQ7_9ACTO|nr:cell wall-binding repeat-containing protein [Mobiluncus curtisii]ADI67444.1 putative cell wall binding repeat 2 [Mobiluncus curtisii ATCC 43063]QQU08827.1 cell wall-binding repeat-containing protein [Mobiluncus curtisii]SQB65364.1 Putative cell wall binding repeat 2 [Mobiluncus curtisii]
MNLKKKFVIGAASLALVAGMGVAPAMAAVVPLPNGGEFNLDAQRLAGESRLATSMAVAAKAYKDKENTVQTVYLIGYDAVVDAATAGMLNRNNLDASVDGPMLSAPKDATTQKMLGAFIKKTFPSVSTIVAVGGTSVVPDADLKNVADAAGVASDRLNGKNRYETAVEIAKKAYPAGADRLYLTRGDNPVDALAAGTLEKAPVLLVNHEGDVDKSVVDYVKSLGIGRDAHVMVIGGEDALSKEQVDKLFKGANLPKHPDVTPWTAEEVKASYKAAVKSAAAVWFGQTAWQQTTANMSKAPRWNYGDGLSPEKRALELEAINSPEGFFSLGKSALNPGEMTENENNIDISDGIDATGKAFEGYTVLAPKYEKVKQWNNSTAANQSIYALQGAWDKAVQDVKNAKVTAGQLASKELLHRDAGAWNGKVSEAHASALKTAIANVLALVGGKAGDDNTVLSGAVTSAAGTSATTLKQVDADKVAALRTAMDDVAGDGVTCAKPADNAKLDDVIKAIGVCVADTTNFTAANGWGAASATKDNANEAIDDLMAPAAFGTHETTDLYKAAVALFGKDSVDKNWVELTNDGKIKKSGMFTFVSNDSAARLSGVNTTPMVNADKASGAYLFYIEKDKNNSNHKKAFEDASSAGLSATEFNATIADLAERDAKDLKDIFTANQTDGNATDVNKNHSINWAAVKALVNERVAKFEKMQKAAGEKLIKAVMDYNWVVNPNGSEMLGGDGKDGVCRINGKDRYQTSALLSIFQSKPDTDVLMKGCQWGEGRFDQMKSVYLASGTQDHLIDPVFAGTVKDGTILLVPGQGDVETLVASELKRKGTAPRKAELLKEGIAANAVWAVGGKNAISDDVFTNAVNAMFGKKVVEKSEDKPAK